jgi:hypothetical protein
MLPTNPLLNATAPAGPHLPAAMLRQYAAGTLATAAQHRVEAHTLACPRCADVLEGFLQTPPATTDQALAQLQQRLRKRVQQAAPTRQVLAPRQHRWLAPQLATAAALLLGLVAGGWWAWQQRQHTPAAQLPTTSVPHTAPVVAPPTTTELASAASPTAPVAVARPAARRATAPLVPPTRHSLPKLTGKDVAVAKQPAVAEALNKAVPDLVTPAPAVPAALPTAPVASTVAPADSLPLAERGAGLALHNSADDAARVRVTTMPAAAGLAPAPVGGTGALREKLRREAAEFVPEAPEQRLSGTVQLRLTIGATGKLEKIIVRRGLRADYDAEAQRLVCEGPAWVPGTSGGRRAAREVDIAVPF